MEIKKIDISKIKEGPIRHATLPDELIKRIKAFKEILADVETISLEETINNFKQDKHPEREVNIWEHITKVYQLYILEKKIIDLPTKKEVFSVVLRTSMGVTLEDISDTKLLSKEQVKNIFTTMYSYYNKT